MIINANPGSIVKCELLNGIFYHTGIYTGNDKIVELDGKGMVRSISVFEFANASWLRTGKQIFVACYMGTTLGNPDISERAIKFLNTRFVYNPILQNCYQFTINCITGKLKKTVYYYRSVDQNIRTFLNCGKSFSWEILNINNFKSTIINGI